MMLMCLCAFAVLSSSIIIIIIIVVVVVNLSLSLSLFNLTNTVTFPSFEKIQNFHNQKRKQNVCDASEN